MKYNIIGILKKNKYNCVLSFTLPIYSFEILGLYTFLFFPASFQFKTHPYSQKTKLINQKKKKKKTTFVSACFLH